ncbi:hypothetical protein NIES4102_14540 [Chondrocystis sp. NIES-4102]|nr:hypothetical protein NIES4102_14540 [Chondrocystis sp. NIES-4102]
MNLEFLKQQSQAQANSNQTSTQNTTQEKILCPHCRRTATNGIKCKGICVAESDY